MAATKEAMTATKTQDIAAVSSRRDVAGNDELVNGALFDLVDQAVLGVVGLGSKAVELGRQATRESARLLEVAIDAGFGVAETATAFSGPFEPLVTSSLGAARALTRAGTEATREVLIGATHK